MQIVVLGVITCFKQELGCFVVAACDGDHRETYYVYTARSCWFKEIGDAQLAPFTLPRESKALNLSQLLEIVIDDYVISLALGGVKAIDDLWLKQPGGRNFVL